MNRKNSAPPADGGSADEDRDRLQELAEQQHEQQVDAQDADDHRLAEAGEQLHHELGFAGGDLVHAGRQILAAPAARRALLQHVAERQAVEIGLDRDVAAAVVARDARRPGAQRDFGDAHQRHRSRLARHGQQPDALEVAARVVAQLHANRNLPAGEIQFREAVLDIARRRDARDGAERVGRDAELGGAIRQRTNDDLRLQQARARGDVANAGHRAQVALDRGGCRVQLLGIVAASVICSLPPFCAPNDSRTPGMSRSAARRRHLEFLLRDVALVARRQLIVRLARRTSPTESPRPPGPPPPAAAPMML